MANRKNTFLIKRSNISGKVPSAGDLLLGELALNTADVILYTSGTTANSILPIGWDRVSRTGDTMTGNFNFFGDVEISGSSLPYGYALSVTGDTNFIGDVYVSGDITYNGNLLVTGGTIIQSGLTATTIYTDYIDFNTTYTGQTLPAGRLQWDDGNGTLVLGLKGGTSNMEIGLENMALCFNSESTTLTAGTIVYVSGSQGNRPAIKRAIATSDGYSVTTLGVVSESIASGAEGFVTTFGMVNNLNTIGYSGGTPIWLSPTVYGEFTSVKPQAPQHTVLLGYVVRVHASVGSIFTHISNGWEIDELHDVRLNGRSLGDLLSYSAYNGSNVWVNSKTLNGSYTITGDTTVGGQMKATTVSAVTISATTLYGNGSNLTGISSSTFTGGTVTGGAVFINGLTANTLSSTTITADTYLNLPPSTSGTTTGDGIANYLPKWTGSTGQGNSQIRDDGTNISIGSAPSTNYKFSIFTYSNNYYSLFVRNASNLDGARGIYGVSDSGIGNQIGVVGVGQGHSTTGTSIGIDGTATDGLLGIGVRGIAGPSEFGSMTTGIGGYFDGKGDGSYGYPTNSYSVQLLDGTEGINKILVSQTTDGKANWSSTLSGLTSINTTSLIATNIFVTGGTASIFSGNSSVEMVKIIQTGSGDAFVVQDQANDDSSHFVINASGNTAIGLIAPLGNDKLTVSGQTSIYGNTTTTTLSATSITADTVTTFIPIFTPLEIYRGITFRNNSTTIDTYGGIAMSTTASNLAQSVSSTNFASKQIRLRYYATVVSGGRYTGTRGSALLWFIGGGFRYVCDFNISDTAFASTCQQFYGLAGQTTDLGYGGVGLVQVSTLTNLIGLGNDGTDTNLQIIHNDSGGTATKIDLGVNFPANRTAGAASTTVYSLTLYNDPASNYVKYMVINNETGAVAMGTIITNLPNTTQGLNFFASRAMGSGGGVTNSGQFDLLKLGVNSLL